MCLTFGKRLNRRVSSPIWLASNNKQLASLMTTQPDLPEKPDSEAPEKTQSTQSAETESPSEASPEQEGVADEALAAAEAKVAQYHDEILRIRAEAENMRKRAARDAENSRKFALERFMTDLLDVKDNLERGLEAANADGAGVEQLREGTELTLKTLAKALEKHGLTEVDPVGEMFDPERHEALSMIPSPDHAPNTVVTVIQKGYVLNERLLRPARVMVAKGD